MKWILSLAFIAIGLGVQAQAPRIQRAEIKTPTVQCEMCKNKIESTAPKYLDGLAKITVNVKRKVTQVQWHPDRTNIEEIKTAIANAGYDADDVEANPDAYKRLPKCCKKPEDREGPKQ